jgi:uncharacterized phage protein gp47/JayE
MPFDRPDLQTLITRVTADMNSRFPGAYNRLRRTVIAVFARVLAGLAHGLYGYLDWLSKQILPDTMEEDRLIRFGTIMGVTYPVAAKATGAITVTGTDGAVIPVDTLWQSASGIEYVVTTETAITGGSASVPVSAVMNGASGNAVAGTVLTIVSPISGVTSDAAVDASGLTGGIDAMDIEAYRARVLTRTATSYTGANAAIYEAWTKEVAGVTRAWVYENTPSAGSVTVLFVCDDQAGSIIPDAGLISDVTDYLEEHADPFTGQLVGRAVNCTLVVAGPVAHEVDFTILPTPDTAAVRTAISASITDYLRREAYPGEDIHISRIRNAISSADGVTDYVLTSPTSNVVIADGSIAVLGEITWA